MPTNALHDEYDGASGSRLRIAVVAVLAAVVPVALMVYTARESLRPLIARYDVIPAFSLTFLSILFEALPFVLLGALVSGLIEMFVSPQRMLRLIPKSALGQLAAGATIGVFLPVCECGVVVVVRRLLRKGMPLRMALAYLLAAPIVNPVVIVSTFAAFRGKPEWLFMPVARVGFGVGIAMAVGAWVGRGRFSGWVKVDAGAAEGNTDDPHAGLSVGGRISAACDHAVGEFLDVGRFLIAGALAAAVMQTLVPRSAVDSVAGHPLLAVGGMMALAVALNLCSEADAFVAAGLLRFSAVAKLAFLLLGPMFDVKLLVMYGLVFRRPLVRRLVVAILVSVFAVTAALALAESVWFGGSSP